MDRLSVRCIKCEKGFNLWNCPNCGKDNTPEGSLKGFHIKNIGETVREVLFRIISKYLERDPDHPYGFSTIDVCVPTEKHPRLLPLPAVEELLAMLCGLGLMSLDSSKEDRGWACYLVSPEEFTKICNTLKSPNP